MKAIPHIPRRSHNGSRGTRYGFTLIELLVVVMIISMLMALLLPTVQAAREASRRSVCANNVKQLALGCLQHLDQQGFYPSGGWGDCWAGDPDRGFGKNQPGSWAFSILPSIEQLPLFMMASDGDPASITTTQEGLAELTGRAPLPVFTCPSRRQAISHPTPMYAKNNLTMRNSSAPTTTNRSDYKMNGGAVRITWGVGPTRSEGNSLFPTGFVDMAGTNGVVAQRSEVRAAHVFDGLSSTYLVGEKHLNPNNYYTGLDLNDDCSMFAGSDLDTVAWTGDSIANVLTPLPPTQDTPGLLNPVFGGVHANVFIMSMADGSTHSIGYDVDGLVHLRRGSRNDRQPTPAP
jgi:prepilin-type N-terminal cleavage/methylation domain-containing protein